MLPRGHTIGHHGKLLFIFVLVAFPFWELSQAAAACPSQGSLALEWNFQDHMVLQRGKAFIISGRTGSGVKVTVRLTNEVRSAVADANGKWNLLWPALKAASGLQLQVTDECGGKIIKSDVSVGEVFLCAGQSNMSFPLSRSKLTGRFDHLVNAKNYMRMPMSRKQIRFMRMSDDYSFVSQSSSSAKWQSAGTTNSELLNFETNILPNFSSLCFFAGRNIHSEMAVPVGLIVNSQGGTRVEEWIPKEDFTASGLPLHTPFLYPIYSHRGPGTLYNSRMFPLKGTRLSAVIWYQGETNVSDHDNNDYYKKLMARFFPAMSNLFGSHKVYIIQLANFGRRSWINYDKAIECAPDQCDVGTTKNPDKAYADKLPDMWLVQDQIAKSNPNAHLVTATDSYSSIEADCKPAESGCTYDPYHPVNKLGVAYRVAWSILRNNYGHPVSKTPESPRIIFKNISPTQVIARLSVPLSSLDSLSRTIINGFTVEYSDGSKFHVPATYDLTTDEIYIALPKKTGLQAMKLKYKGTANFVGQQLWYRTMPVLPTELKLN